MQSRLLVFCWSRWYLWSYMYTSVCYIYISIFVICILVRPPVFAENFENHCEIQIQHCLNGGAAATAGWETADAASGACAAQAVWCDWLAGIGFSSGESYDLFVDLWMDRLSIVFSYDDLCQVECIEMFLTCMKLSKLSGSVQFIVSFGWQVQKLETCLWS